MKATQVPTSSISDAKWTPPTRQRRIPHGMFHFCCDISLLMQFSFWTFACRSQSGFWLLGKWQVQKSGPSILSSSDLREQEGDRFYEANSTRLPECRFQSSHFSRLRIREWLRFSRFLQDGDHERLFHDRGLMQMISNQLSSQEGWNLASFKSQQTPRSLSAGWRKFLSTTLAGEAVCKRLYGYAFSDCVLVAGK